MNDDRKNELKEGWTTIGIRKDLLVKLKTVAAMNRENATNYFHLILAKALEKQEFDPDYAKYEEKVLDVLRLKQELKAKEKSTKEL